MMYVLSGERIGGGECVLGGFVFREEGGFRGRGSFGGVGGWKKKKLYVWAVCVGVWGAKRRRNYMCGLCVWVCGEPEDNKFLTLPTRGGV